MQDLFNKGGFTSAGSIRYVVISYCTPAFIIVVLGLASHQSSHIRVGILCSKSSPSTPPLHVRVAADQKATVHWEHCTGHVGSRPARQVDACCADVFGLANPPNDRRRGHPGPPFLARE